MNKQRAAMIDKMDTEWRFIMIFFVELPDLYIEFIAFATLSLFAYCSMSLIALEKGSGSIFIVSAHTVHSSIFS